MLEETGQILRQREVNMYVKKDDDKHIVVKAPGAYFSSRLHRSSRHS